MQVHQNSVGINKIRETDQPQKSCGVVPQREPVTGSEAKYWTDTQGLAELKLLRKSLIPANQHGEKFTT